MPEQTLEQYVGRYKLQPGFLIIVTRHEGQLSAQATGQSRAEIYPSQETEFCYRVVDATVTFQIGIDRKATSLTLHQAGREFKCRKLPD